MANEIKPVIKTIKIRLPKWVRCPSCCQRQPFKKERENWKFVKDININRPKLLKVQTVYAKCLNPNCKVNSFALRGKFERYQRATARLKTEAVASLIADNSTLPRVAERLNRSFNITGSISAIDRWKHLEADKNSFKDIISRLGFSGILCIDEYKPKRSRTYDLIASDGLKGRILYLENVPGLYAARAGAGSIGRGHVQGFLYTLQELGVRPYAAIFDMAAVYPKQIRKVYPDILMQFDYFHIVKEIFRYFKNAIVTYRKELKKEEFDDMASEIWQFKWSLLRNFDKLSMREHGFLENIMRRYRGTIIEKILIFKEQVRDIFNLSKTRFEAYARRRELIQSAYWRDSYHLSKIVQFISSWKFEYMITYLSHPEIPRSGNSESCIRRWRQMEKVRYGLTAKGRQDHLKLYQIHRYLRRTEI